jgi:transcription antitermination factor NusG
MEMQWYALHSKPNKEENLWQELCSRGYEVFYPQIRVQPVNPRARKRRPYFPGYLFVRVDLLTVGFSALAWMPFSTGPVCFDLQPSPISEELIHILQHRVEQINAAGGELFDSLRHGEVVQIEAGPFAGYEAIFDARLPGSERVRVLLKLLSRQQVPLVLPAGLIHPKKSQVGLSR